jgi:peptidoglycan/xylan/chitin deacetylase (PgdA/CDA1 family)
MNLRSVKHAVKRTFSSPWGWRILGPMLRAPGVIVLMYHRIQGEDRSYTGLPVDTFAAQMGWLRDTCDPIAPEALADRVRGRRSARPAVLVTFDDGYRDYHDLAYPVLKRHGIPALVFLATSFLDEGGVIWTDRVQWAVLSTTRDRVKLPWSDGPAIGITDENARAALGERVRDHLKTLPDRERRAGVEALLTELGDPPPRERQMLTWNEVRDTMDLTRYGGHSHTHPILSRLDREQAVYEIRTCRDRIADETGRVPTTFAYPNGRPADYTRETQEILKSHGFTVAFATSEGIAGADTDWMAVERLPGDATDIPDFAWIAAGLSRAP